MNPRNPIVLCVDDVAANLELLESILVPRGYAVVSAASGKDALLMISTQTVDLVLLDVMMPGMDGFEVCRQIKENPDHRNIPVIMITALTAGEDRIRGIEAGAEEFLSKPLDKTEALARIKMLLKVKGLDDDRRRAEKALQTANDRLQESEERYRVIVESSRDLVFFIDQGQRLRWGNQASRVFFGDIPAEDDLFSRVHPDDSPRVAAAWRVAREGDGSFRTISYRLRGTDGGYRTLESNFRRISFGGEELWCVISTDTTELTRLRRKVASQQEIAGMVGRDPKMLELNASIRELAGEDVPVLILGESGTGKELIAAAIHSEGPRAAKNFVAINCGALPDTLLETELFGHMKGSFTGAHRDKKGRFELADGGSIFLDEVGDLSLAMQVKLLRVLQEGTFEKVGAEKSCTVDVRVISATNRDLKREVAANRFREDLFYRLSVVPLAVPPCASG